MHISDVLRGKGRDVVTVPPDTTVRDLLDVLSEFGIGATVVSADGENVDGIVSERDVVRALAARGAVVLSEDVSTIMTREVVCTEMTEHVDSVFAVMTQQRIRHLPVLIDDRLGGLVSIGDLVKARMGELETERDTLAQYISSATT
jgi:CBS domain-containing protein